MDKLTTELSNLVIFIISFLILYLPCVVGTLCGIRFNQLNEQRLSKTRKKYDVSKTIRTALVSSIVPTLIMMVAEYMFPGAANMSYIIKYALVVLFGFIGADKITTYMMDISNTIKVLKAIQEGAPALASLADVLAAAANNTNTKEENNEKPDDKDDKK